MYGGQGKAETTFPKNFKLPTSLPKLKTLKIYSLDLFKIGKKVVEPNPSNYPKLKSLAFGREWYYLADDDRASCLTLANIPNPNITELELIDSISTKEMLKKAQFLFPNVTSFTCNTDNEEFIALACSGWKLENLKVIKDFGIHGLHGLIKYTLPHIPLAGLFTICLQFSTHVLNTKS